MAQGIQVTVSRLSREPLRDLIQEGLVVDQAATEVSAGFRATPGYREQAPDLYGRCDRAALRHVLHEVRAISG